MCKQLPETSKLPKRTINRKGTSQNRESSGKNKDGLQTTSLKTLGNHFQNACGHLYAT